MAPKTDVPWTLRCKIHTATVMVSLPKSSSFTVLKNEVLDLLKGAYPGGTIETEEGSIPIPESISDIVLGKLIDPADIRGGWEAIEDESSDTPLNGKGKAVAGRALQNGASKSTLESAGLKDFALVGMRFKGFEGLVQRSIEDDATQDDWPIILPQTKAPIDEDEDDIPGLSHIDPETGRLVLAS